MTQEIGTQNRTPSVLLVDGYSLIYRGFHALPLLSSGGVYTNAVLGFFSMLLKALTEYRPDNLCVMLDMHAPTFRHTMYDEYKATRKPMPEELRPQIPVIREILEAMGVSVFEMEGYEADDLLGTASRIAVEDGRQAYILTGDRDSLQLVGGATRVILTRKGISESLLLDEEKVYEIYGYTPAQAIDIKALMGDSGDNIPGIPGIGEKTALKLIGEYGTLENVLAHAKDVKGKLGEKLQNGREAAELSRELGTICTTAPIKIDFNVCGWSRLMEGMATLEKYHLTRLCQSVRVLMGEAEAVSGEASTFSSPKGKSKLTLRAIPQEEPIDMPAFPPVQDCGTVSNAAEITALAEQIARDAGDGAVALNIGRESVTLCLADGRLWRIPLALDLTMQGLYEDQILQALRPLVEKTPLIVHGAKALFGMLSAYGLPLPIVKHDTLLGAYLLHPAQKGFVLETTLSAEYGEAAAEDARQSSAAKHAAGSSAEASAKAGKKKSAEEDEQRSGITPSAYEVYALSVRQAVRLQHQNMLALLTEMEQPLTKVLFAMEKEGFGVDLRALGELSAQFGAEIEALKQEVYRLTGTEGFNLNSPKQLGEILFEKLGLPTGKKGKTGAYSTDVSVLEGLSEHHPAIEPLLRYRKLSKLQNTYIEGLRKVTDVTGRVHTTFDQTGTLTGRISSLEPNLQNIPVRSEEGREIRKAFVAKDGFVLLDADYSQIELRVLAHLSGDPAMQDAFLKGQDIHTRTSAEVYGVPMEEVTAMMRSSAKAVNFGIVYGISGFGLARNIGISRKEADAFIATYFERYPGVHAFMERMKEQGYEQGYAETMFHRRRALPELAGSNHNVRAFGERAAMNTPVQGTAADIIKMAMRRVKEELEAGGFRARLILQVHDELVVECPEEEIEAVSALLQAAMENVVSLTVPLVAEVSTGKNWFDAH